MERWQYLTCNHPNVCLCWINLKYKYFVYVSFTKFLHEKKRAIDNIYFYFSSVICPSSFCNIWKRSVFSELFSPKWLFCVGFEIGSCLEVHAELVTLMIQSGVGKTHMTHPSCFGIFSANLRSQFGC